MKSSTDTYLKISIALLVIVLILFGFILWRQYIHATGGRMPLHVTLNVRRRSGPLPVSSAASTVQPWMTFDYIDYLFALPPHYLQTTLNITDQAYPRISISRYGVLAATTPANALATVKQAIENYTAATSSNTTSNNNSDTNSATNSGTNPASSE